jgi:hypothetical protein
MSSGHKTRGHSCVLFQSKNIDVLATLDITRGHLRTCPMQRLCVLFEKIRHVLKGHFHLSTSGSHLCSIKFHQDDSLAMALPYFLVH